ncbi:unnamed protein product [Durusdinium trenchii]|uniref:Uncharacterized protein n=1 Tax=Durusdinium trenchii TaxID=1381693 RepID=A0ABP0NIR1_9DINO
MTCTQGTWWQRKLALRLFMRWSISRGPRVYLAYVAPEVLGRSASQHVSTTPQVSRSVSGLTYLYAMPNTMMPDFGSRRFARNSAGFFRPTCPKPLFAQAEETLRSHPRGRMEAPPPPPPDDPPGPAIEVTSLEMNPAEECAFEDGLGLAIGFTSDSPLLGFTWRISYVVDTAKRRYIVQVGQTEPADYAPGPNAMTYLAEGLSIEEVPKARQSLNGKSSMRIQRLFLQACRCSKQCFERLAKQLDELGKFLELFWKLGKLQQDTYVHT